MLSVNRATGHMWTTYFASFSVLRHATAAFGNTCFLQFDSNVVIQMEEVLGTIACFSTKSHPDTVVVLDETYLGSPTQGFIEGGYIILVAVDRFDE